MLTAFVTAFSTPPTIDAFAPTFQRLSARFRDEMAFFGVNECGNLEDVGGDSDKAFRGALDFIL